MKRQIAYLQLNNNFSFIYKFFFIFKAFLLIFPHKYKSLFVLFLFTQKPKWAPNFVFNFSFLFCDLQ